MRYWLEERKEGDKVEALMASLAVNSFGAQAETLMYVSQGRTQAQRG